MRFERKMGANFHMIASSVRSRNKRRVTRRRDLNRQPVVRGDGMPYDTREPGSETRSDDPFPREEFYLSADKQKLRIDDWSGGEGEANRLKAIFSSNFSFRPEIDCQSIPVSDNASSLSMLHWREMSSALVSHRIQLVSKVRRIWNSRERCTCARFLCDLRMTIFLLE